MKDKFIAFLRSEKMLSEFELNYKEHGLREGQTFDEFLDKTEPKNYIAMCFQWNETSRCEVNDKTGQRFWNTLSHKWRDYMKNPTTKPKASDRQKIRKYILVYLKAFKVGEVFYGTQLATYCIEKAKTPSKHKSTVLAYMNQMQREVPRKLNYKCVNRQESKYIKL